MYATLFYFWGDIFRILNHEKVVDNALIAWYNITNKRQGGKLEMKTFKLNNRRPLATLSLSAFYALGIFDTNGVQSDEVLVAFYNGEERGRFSWCKLYKNAEGDVFFKKFGKRYYLKDFFKKP